MARRRRGEEEHENHERWLVSYADFITLLFAFFVVMYSLSSLNEGKYRIMSDSVVNAFRNIATNSNSPRIISSPIPSIRPSPPPSAADSAEADEARKSKPSGYATWRRKSARCLRRWWRTGRFG